MIGRRAGIHLLAAVAVGCLAAGDASAWPSSLMQSLSRDARRLLPPSLARLMAEREPQIFEAAARFPPEVSQALWADLGAGQLRPQTVAALDARAAEVVSLFRAQRVITHEGYFYHKYNPDGSPASSWHPWIMKGHKALPIQEDETALVVYSLWQHYRCFHDIDFVSSHYHRFVTPAAGFLVSYREPHTHLPAASYNLWEERHGIFTYTTATVYAGLDAAASFAVLFGEEELASRYRQAAEEIKEAALRYLWDEERGHYLRMITVDKSGTIQKDPTLDSSVCALFQFGMLPAHDSRIK